MEHNRGVDVGTEVMLSSPGHFDSSSTQRSIGSLRSGGQAGDNGQSPEMLSDPDDSYGGSILLS